MSTDNISGLSPASRGAFVQILSQNASMPWETFVNAMEEMGFHCEPDSSGSCIRFHPPASSDAAPIIIDKPHPDPLLTPVMQQQIGQRLRHHYGWEGHIFLGVGQPFPQAKAADGATQHEEAQPGPRLTRSEEAMHRCLGPQEYPGEVLRAEQWESSLKAVPPKPGGQVADGSQKTTMEEAEEAEANGAPAAGKKKKKPRKRGGKNKKKPAANAGTPEEANDAVHASPSFETKRGGFNSAASSLFGKGKEEQGNKNAKYTWFSRLSKKATESMEQLLKTSEEAGKAPSPMKWETFLKLMREMGFEYDPSTAGNSVRFDPPNPKDKSITIHKPHPDPTLTPIMVRQIGRRLKGYYGWDEEDFIRQTRERAGK